MSPYNIHYVDHVDIEPSIVVKDSLVRVRGIIHTHIKQEDMGLFVDGLLGRGLLNYFKLRMRNFSKNKRSWVTLVPIPRAKVDAIVGIDSLFNYLEIEKRPIIWKVECYGYQIKKDGEILRSWPLL